MKIVRYEFPYMLEQKDNVTFDHLTFSYLTQRFLKEAGHPNVPMYMQSDRVKNELLLTFDDLDITLGYSKPDHTIVVEGQEFPAEDFEGAMNWLATLVSEANPSS